MNPTAPTPENQPVGQVPEVPQAPEVAPVPSSAPVAPQQPAQIPAVPTPAPAAAAPLQDDQPVAPIPGAPPAVADDVDVIEKEWVDQAEAVVKRTEGDPHAEEEAVEELQVDYLKKRYDHSVDKPTD